MKYMQCHITHLLLQETVTPENVGNVTSTLADLVSRANNTVDQSPRNLGVVGSVFNDTTNLISGGNLSSDNEVCRHTWHLILCVVMCIYNYFVCVVPHT